MVLPLYANLVKHDNSLLEAAQDLGSSNFNNFWKITVPLSKAGIIAGAMTKSKNIGMVGGYPIPEVNRLMNAFIAGVREVIAVIADRSADASIRLHERLGFEEVGRMGRVGYKYDRWLGTVTMRLRLKGIRRRPFLR